MRIASVVVALVVCLGAGLIVAQHADAGAEQPAAATASPPVFAPQAEMLAKKCSFNSDCPYGQCKSGECGGCSFDSDCKGWGKCKGGQCGSCGFDSDCKGFGSCSGGRCSQSPY